MFLRNTTKESYVKNLNVRDFKIGHKNEINVSLFDKDIQLEDDPWMWHLHLKLTDLCQAKCCFCIEQGSCSKEYPELYIKRVDEVLTEMNNKNILHSVSVTGGEPLLFKYFDGLVGVLKKHNIKFLTMNTNAEYLKDKVSVVDGVFDFINISRHSLSDKENRNIFKRDVPSIDDLKFLKSILKQAKVRLQHVITKETSYEYFCNFLKTFNFVDDFSFRMLMSPSDIHSVSYDISESNKSYKEILNKVYENGELIEQVLQDYYVYEVWKINNSQVTFSYSDMNTLIKEEDKEAGTNIRELVLHPNGTFSGSWNVKNKIILNSFV